MAVLLAGLSFGSEDCATIYIRIFVGKLPPVRITTQNIPMKNRMGTVKLPVKHSKISRKIQRSEVSPMKIVIVLRLKIGVSELQ